ncbi:aminopeptidase P family protein [Xanthovirga aplysinae]|uniref:aminopeptidase P family protein n=1 Tax=Xanthovirga aplysinae TaxID=2529853 RepID=UPI0012BD2F1F|nr:aminopeptidase P family protein [Xanthovirga aplysinae]MTI30381.1 aminopeptidase P family protein [Xanthovirga aplysinae]
MKIIISFCAVFCLLFPFSVAISQDHLPTDFLDKDFHKGRRDAVRKLMPPNSIAVFFANPIRNRSNDVDYVYHQDPDFYYLTGYREPNAVMLLFSDIQHYDDGDPFNEMIFVQPRDPQSEMWNGRRLGVEGVKTKLGLDRVYENSQFASVNIDYSSFDKIMFIELKKDVKDNPRDDSDLFSLIYEFKKAVDFPVDFDSEKFRLYDLIRTVDESNGANVAQVVGRDLNYLSEYKNDDILNAFVNAGNIKDKIKVARKIPENKLDGYSLAYMMNSLREVKSPEELVLLRKAINISAIGQREVMKAMQEGMSELEIQGIHEFVFKKYGAEYEGYPSIVGAGNNGCVLHYIDNSKTKVEDELVLMDLGAEYHGYSADVTRTIPVNGKFNKEQRAIYELVYKAQEAGFEACKPGASFRAPHEAARAVINQGLKELGIISDVEVEHNYFPHGTSHYLGLDVHDRGNYGDLKEGTVITVEPGIYIPEGSPCDKKWWGIAVRIEDDILITKEGFENLSKLAPRAPEEIENLMKTESPLQNFKLPEL